MVKSSFKRIVFGITVVFVMLINTTVTPFAETVSFSDGSSAEKITYENNEIYYSDDYFRSASTEYDPHLSTVSMYMTYFSNTELTGKPTDMGDAEWYKGQSKYVKGYFERCKLCFKLEPIYSIYYSWYFVVLLNWLRILHPI